MIALSVVLVVVVITALYFWTRFNYAGKLMAQIPGPTALPIIGNTLTLLLYSTPEKLFMFPRIQFVKYGDIHKLEAPGFRAVGIYNPCDVETLCASTTFIQKEDPYNFLKPWLNEGLLTSNGQKWQERRKLLTPVFHFNRLMKYLRIFHKHTDSLLRKIEESGIEQTDVMTLVSNTTLNVMCETSLGFSMNKEKENGLLRYFKALHVFGDCVAYRISKIWLHSDFMFRFVKAGLSQKKAVQDLHAFTTNIIKERKTCLKHEKIIDNVGYDQKNQLALLDLLIRNENKGKIDVEGIREEVDTFLFEGHDTTSVALSFMIVRIANEPTCQNRIYEEIINILGDTNREPTIEDLRNMKYLECCIKESMRLYPSVPFIARFTTEDVKLSGYLVPAGTQCQIHIYDIHRREDYYPEPEKFIPERFTIQNSVKRHPYAYIPFSAGPRNCIGQKFAMMEMKIMMSGLLRRFRLEAVTKPEDIIFKADLVLRSSKPLLVRFHSRQKTEKI
ncbi:cytochrome P450 4C1-like [Battus philenor]|uniref:cytochrome P450 4C1-like n=1 Tax=Battus philenor TaxID=42288 RepID=UPI0035CEC203